VLVGLVTPDSMLTLEGQRLVRQCVHIVGAYNYASWHLVEAIKFLERTGDTFPLDEIFSPALPLSQINEAIELAATRQWLRVTLDCSETHFSNS
jgi:D-arabinose 1-dehydrogenase-like Zn-dependent alcohol dehydrogenase